ncbi:MAG TPA: FAD-binding oxidoreductase [Granulicella sp.]
MKRRHFLQLLGASSAALTVRPLYALSGDHVVIAGAGIIGSSIAYHLVKRGAQVTVLEREHPAAGTTKDSFAWLNASSKSPRAYYDLNLMGMMGWRRLELEIGSDALPLQWGGGIQWCENSAMKINAMKKHVAERQAWGYDSAMIDRAELESLLPHVTPGEFGAGNIGRQEGTVDPVTAAQALITKAKALGAKVLYPCEITGLSADNGSIHSIETTQGPMTCDHLVLAAGNGTPALAEKLGINIPLVKSLGILAHSAPQTHTITRVVMPPGADIKQNMDGRIVTGSNFGDTGDTQPTDELGHQLLAKAASFLPEVKTAKLERMSLGHRVMPKDGFPIVGRCPGHPGVYVASMHSGMTLSPIIGQLAALEILDGVTVDLLQTFRPERFA